MDAHVLSDGVCVCAAANEWRKYGAKNRANACSNGKQNRRKYNRRELKWSGVLSLSLRAMQLIGPKKTTQLLYHSFGQMILPIAMRSRLYKIGCTHTHRTAERQAYIRKSFVIQQLVVHRPSIRKHVFLSLAPHPQRSRAENTCSMVRRVATVTVFKS